MFQENTLCLNEEIIEGEEEICSNDREILQKTGSNELSDQSTSITEVYNPLIREGNEEATPQWLKEDDGTTEVVRDILSVEYSITEMAFEKNHSPKLLSPSCYVFPCQYSTTAPYYNIYHCGMWTCGLTEAAVPERCNLISPH
jgi:hypothetical protein